MGACVSTQRKSHSAMKVQVIFGSNDVNSVKQPIIIGDLAVTRQSSFREYGSKEETFFDSQAWLESDCDDDFMSVNGEFTPSRGNTPVHHNFAAGNNKPHHAVVFPYQPSPNEQENENKIRLSDLFKDSLRRNYDFKDEQDGELVQNGVNLKPESPIVHDGEVVAKRGNRSKTKRERFGNCFPTMLSSRSTSINRRKLMSQNSSLSSNQNHIVVGR